MYSLQIKIESFKKNDFLKKNINQIKNILKLKNNITNIQKRKQQKIFTLLRSPHVNKKSREQFIFEKNKQIYKIEDKNLYKLLNFLIIYKKLIGINNIIKVKIIKK